MFIPVCKEDLIERGWEELDFIYILGDAYVDHPSFGAAIITRVLEAFGYKIGIIPHPDVKNDESFKILGEPKYGFMISAGNIDTMVNMYTSSKRLRSEDVYQEEVKEEYVVYRTRTGKKYHSSGCRYLSQSCIEITFENAEYRGLKACSVCQP
jgi:hypothetical protein